MEGTENGTAQPAAASSTTAPASSGGVTSGTASEALIKAASAASSAAPAPVGSTGDTTQKPVTGNDGATTGTTAQPTAEGQADTTANRGPIPLDRHEAAVRNAREKGRQEAETRFAWAKNLSPSAVKDVPLGLQLVNGWRTDGAQLVRTLAEQMGMTVVPKGRQGQPPAEESFDPDLETQDGKVKAFSAERVRALLTSEIDRVRAEMRGEMQPLVERHRTEQERQADGERRAAARQTSTNTLTHMRTLEGFTEHEAEIKQRLIDLPAETRQEMGAIGALYHVYTQVLSEKVLPSFGAQAEQRVREANSKKAVASRGSTHPTDAGGTGGKSPDLNNPTALARHMEKMAATMV